MIDDNQYESLFDDKVHVVVFAKWLPPKDGFSEDDIDVRNLDVKMC